MDSVALAVGNIVMHALMFGGLVGMLSCLVFRTGVLVRLATSLASSGLGSLLFAIGNWIDAVPENQRVALTGTVSGGLLIIMSVALFVVWFRKRARKA